MENQAENRGEIIIYRAEDNTVQLDVRMEHDTVWLTASQMAVLFGRDVKTIYKHINNALREELDKALVVANFASTKKYGRREGYTQEIETALYNLDVIISVGYRVKSQRGVQFRQWAKTEYDKLEEQTQWVIDAYNLSARNREYALSDKWK